MGSKNSKNVQEAPAKKQKGRAAEVSAWRQGGSYLAQTRGDGYDSLRVQASAKGEYSPDEFQTAAFDLKCLIQDSEEFEGRLQVSGLLRRICQHTSKSRSDFASGACSCTQNDIDAARKKAKQFMKQKPPRKKRVRGFTSPVRVDPATLICACFSNS